MRIMLAINAARKKLGSKAGSLFTIFFKTNSDFKLAFLAAGLVVILGALLGWKNNQSVLLSPDINLRYLLEPHNPLSFLANWDGAD
jgi:hypothetical protein